MEADPWRKKAPDKLGCALPTVLVGLMASCEIMADLPPWSDPVVMLV